jgi:hypothetical protein
LLLLVHVVVAITEVQPEIRPEVTQKVAADEMKAALKRLLANAFGVQVIRS